MELGASITFDSIEDETLDGEAGFNWVKLLFR